MYVFNLKTWFWNQLCYVCQWYTEDWQPGFDLNRQVLSLEGWWVSCGFQYVGLAGCRKHSHCKKNCNTLFRLLHEYGSGRTWSGMEWSVNRTCVIHTVRIRLVQMSSSPASLQFKMNTNSFESSKLNISAALAVRRKQSGKKCVFVVCLTFRLVSPGAVCGGWFRLGMFPQSATSAQAPALFHPKQPHPIQPNSTARARGAAILNYGCDSRAWVLC